MATKRLNEKTLAAFTLSPDRAQDYIWDSELKGFGVVVGRRVRTFVARAWVRGKKRRVVIGTAGEPREDGLLWSVVLARQVAKNLLGAMAEGRDLNAEKRAPKVVGPTLREALELHIENMRAGKNGRRKICSERSVTKIGGEVRNHLAAWLDRPIVELTGVHLKAVCDRIERDTCVRAGSVNRPGVVQANKIIAHVSAVWNAADRLHDLPGKNPAKRLPLSALAVRDVRINDGEFADWYAKVVTCAPVRRDLQLVSLFTGIRADGVRSLRWDDIDEKRGLLHVRKAKGGRPYVLPLVATVREILDGRRRDNRVALASHGGDHGFVFPSLTRDLKTVQAVAEVKERRIDKSKADAEGNAVRVSFLPGIHANRRTFNSVAEEIGVPRDAREALMNHAGKGVNAKHYSATQTWEFLREQAALIEGALWARLKARAA